MTCTKLQTLSRPKSEVQWALDLRNSIRSRGLVITQVGHKSRLVEAV